MGLFNTRSTAGNYWAAYAVRLLIGFAVAAVIITGFGIADVAKDAFGSHRDISTMDKSEFRAGDIVRGKFTETLGCAATIETTEYTMHIIKGNSYTSAYYYVVPFFKSLDAAVPDKIILYKTGNKDQIAMLQNLEDETYDFYYGDISSTRSHVTVDRAEIAELDSQERGAFNDFVDEFVDAYFSNSSAADKIYLKSAYKDAMVPYLVRYNAGGGSFMLPIGLAMLGILVVGIVIYILRKKRQEDATPQYTYVGSPTPVNVNNDPNLNSPTGLKNASDAYFGTGTAAPGSGQNGFNVPKQANTYGLGQSNKFGLRRDQYTKDYSRSERPLPPIDEAAAQNSGPVMYDPQTGAPIYGQKMESVSASGMPPVQPVRQQPQPVSVSDSMPSVDPHSLENVDLSNGGIMPEEKAPLNVVTPHNNNIPIINPESGSSANMFGEVIPYGAPEKEPEPVPEPEKIIPQPSADSAGDNILVEQTDPSARGMFFGASGGDMNSVDPYTEKNVDLSNGGIELPEDTDAPTRMMKPEAPAPAPAAFTAPEPAAPAAASSPAPAAEEKPAESSSYSIFGSDSRYSSYTSSYTGGSSYNIFKTDNKPAASDFPNADQSFPKPDTSFPEAGESDIGGKDDFIF